MILHMLREASFRDMRIIVAWSLKLSLTHWGRVTLICVSKLTIIGSDNRVSPGRLQAIVWWIIVNWTIRNKLQRNSNRNSKIFIQENALEHVVCEMASILSRHQCVNGRWAYIISRLGLWAHKPFVKRVPDAMSETVNTVALSEHRMVCTWPKF